jgi:hypothetical protein
VKTAYYAGAADIPASFEPVPERRQLWTLAAYTLDLIRSAGGGWPETEDDLARLVLRFTGRRLRIMPSGTHAEAFCRRAGWVYVTRDDDPDRMRVQVLHELVEALRQWEGVPPCVCQVSSHDVACQVVLMAA